MKPKNHKALREKEVRKIYRQLDVLYEKRSELKLIKLDKPYRHGWFKELIITTNVDKYANKEHIEEVYRLVEKKVWTKTKEEAERKWRCQISKYLINKEVPTINKKQYNRLSNEAKKLCIPFQYYTERKNLRTRFYVKIPKGAYKIKFTRAYVTHTRNVDPQLDKQIAFLNQKLKSKGYYETERKLFPWLTYDDWPSYIESRQEGKRKVRDLKSKGIKYLINEAC